MTKPLQLKSPFKMRKLSKGQTALFDEVSAVLLEGDAYTSILSLLDGKLTEDELVEALKEDLAPEMVYYALNRLIEKGYIEETSSSLSDSVRALCHYLKIDPMIALERLQSVNIDIQFVGIEKDDRLAEVLTKTGLKVVQQEGALTIVVVADYCNTELKKWPIDKKWCLVKPYGKEVCIGPIFGFKDEGCYSCLLSRMDNHRLLDKVVQAQLGNNEYYNGVFLDIEPLVLLAYGRIAIEVFNWVVFQDNKKLQGKIQSYDVITGKWEQHIITRRPQCKMCGDGGSKEKFLPIILKSRPIKSLDGGLRSISAEDALKKYQKHVSHISGIIEYLHKPTFKGSTGFHVLHSGSNFAFQKQEKNICLKHFRSYTGGKGKTAVQAKLGAICESIERYSGCFFGDEEVTYAAYEEINKEALHPTTLLNFSKNQYSNRLSNEWIHKLYPIPLPLNPNTKIAWTRAWSLTKQRPVYLPTGFCYFKFRDQPLICIGDSNGNAAGHTLEEAILQGFFELVERDSVAIWWYNKLKRPKVDLDQFEDLFFHSTIKQYHKLGREIWVIDITSDLGIPSYAAISFCPGEGPDRIIVGFGAHFVPQIGVERAITEANQMLAMDDTLVNDHPGETAEEFCQIWLKEHKLEDHPFLRGGEEKEIALYPFPKTNDILDDIKLGQKIVEQHGMEMIVLDQSRPDTDLKVVKVIVPGLRHFWPRFAPGRLYDVPVKMGLVNKPLDEHEMNQIPLFV